MQCLPTATRPRRRPARLVIPFPRDAARPPQPVHSQRRPPAWHTPRRSLSSPPSCTPPGSETSGSFTATPRSAFTPTSTGTPSSSSTCGWSRSCTRPPPSTTDALASPRARPTAISSPRSTSDAGRTPTARTAASAVLPHGAAHRRTHRAQRRLARRQYDAGAPAHRRWTRAAVPLRSVHRARGRGGHVYFAARSRPDGDLRAAVDELSRADPRPRSPTSRRRPHRAHRPTTSRSATAHEVVFAQKVALREVNAHSIVNATTRFTFGGRTSSRTRRWSSAASRPFRGARRRPRKRCSAATWPSTTSRRSPNYSRREVHAELARWKADEPRYPTKVHGRIPHPTGDFIFVQSHRQRVLATGARVPKDLVSCGEVSGETGP